jgi:hypothetical protein
VTSSRLPLLRHEGEAFQPKFFTAQSKGTSRWKERGPAYFFEAAFQPTSGARWSFASRKASSLNLWICLVWRHCQSTSHGSGPGMINKHHRTVANIPVPDPCWQGISRIEGRYQKRAKMTLSAATIVVEKLGFSGVPCCGRPTIGLIASWARVYPMLFLHLTRVASIKSYACERAQTSTSKERSACTTHTPSKDHEHSELESGEEASSMADLLWPDSVYLQSPMTRSLHTRPGLSILVTPDLCIQFLCFEARRNLIRGRSIGQPSEQ